MSGGPDALKSVTILGTTGSVGRSTADLVAHHAERFDVYALTAHKDVKTLAAEALRLKAKKAVIADPDLYASLKEALSGSSTEAQAGEAALVDAAAHPVDWTMGAIAGFAGLKPLLAAAERGGILAIANKEPLVAAGEILKDTAHQAKSVLLPVDSEHNAIFQCLQPENSAQVQRVTLTASGGPFLNKSLDEMAHATPEEAVAHPTWSMGAKISVDSATLMNKGLELIEAHILFDLPDEKLDVVIHPQSLVHAFVSYADGSILSHMGASDMKVPILHTLAWPHRMENPTPVLDIQTLGRLDFQPVDHAKFPALHLARQAMKAGLRARIVLNAANEVAVAAFLGKHLPFHGIIETVSAILDVEGSGKAPQSLEEILFLDQDVRAITKNYILNRTHKNSHYGTSG
ncbi:MAG: 1-deoxy-D-xylulose-5-phosphate reductoisomerase [Pseudobdellovibrionaceae bacterium]